MWMLVEQYYRKRDEFKIAKTSSMPRTSMYVIVLSVDGFVQQQ